jgi:SAM-dependent methyltransferase
MARPVSNSDPVSRRLGERTVRDFGDQWTADGGNEGFYGSLDLLADKLGELLSPSDFAGTRVADIGSGAGRIVRMLLAAGAKHVTAVEPSQGVEVLRRNVREFGDRVRVVHGPGEALPADLGADFVTAIGVIQFIPDPLPVLRAVRAALRPGGRAVIWVYSAEGNRLYRGALGALRLVTPHLPHFVLSALATVLTVALDIYTIACRWLPLPLRDYLLTVLSKCTFSKRKYTIYDQLNPTYVRFYRRDELIELLERGGFCDVRVQGRHGYSWTAVAVNPVS